MRGAWPALALAALLASGCLGDAPPSEATLAPAAASPGPAFAGVTYGCPGAPSPSSAPCGTSPPEFSGFTVLDVAVRADPPLLAAVGVSPAAGYAGAVAPVEPGVMVFTSPDGGANWTPHPVPSAPRASARTGQGAPFWAAADFGPDGRLHVVVQVNADLERSVIGGDVPAALQPDADITFLTSPDGGESWLEPVLLSEAAGNSYYPTLIVLGDGTLFATWTDYPAADFVAAWSRDGAAWTVAPPARGDCRDPAKAVALGGRVFVACVSTEFAAVQGHPMVFAADLPNGTVQRLEAALGPPPQDPEADAEPLPDCGAAQLDAQGGGLLLTLSRCPELRLLWSADGTWWNETAILGPEALGLKEGWGSLDLWAMGSAMDSHGALHLLLAAEKMSPLEAAACYCVDTRFMHVAVDPATGKALHGAVLDSIATDEVSSLQSPLGHNPGLALAGDRGWMHWSFGEGRIGWFDLKAT